MKITKNQLRRIIREAVINEALPSHLKKHFNKDGSAKVHNPMGYEIKDVTPAGYGPDEVDSYDPIRSAFDSGVGDAQGGMEPESYHDWIAEDPELMDAYDAGYEHGQNNPAPKSKISNDEFKRIYGDMDVGVRGKAGY